jgi:hypothetical protein
MRSEKASFVLVAVLLVVSTAAHAEPLIGPAVGNPDLLATDGARLYFTIAERESDVGLMTLGTARR